MRNLVYLVAFLLIIQGASAASISINPANIHLSDLQRGGYAEVDVKIGTNSEDEITVLRFLDENATVNDWLTFEPEADEFQLSVNNPHIMKVIIQPPDAIPNGVYEGMLRFRILVEDRFQGQTGSVIELGVSSELRFGISDTEIVSCNILSLNTQNVEKGEDVHFDFAVINNGNIMLTPSVNIDVWNKDQTAVVKTKTYSDYQVLPTVRDQFQVLLSSVDLETDQYFADVSVEECEYKETLTFDILAPGAITTSGRLIKIQNKVWNNVEDDIETKAIFENNGERDVSAVFRGGVYLDNNLVEEFESGYKTISVGAIDEFPIVFTPKEPGRYIVKGRVYYENKQSFEKTSVINVNPKGVEYDGTTKDISGGGSSILIYIIIIIVVLVLLILIKIKRGRH